MRRGALALGLVLAAALVAARPAAAAPAPADVRVMSFNVWLGGDVVDFGGRYVARLMKDDGYGVLAQAPFTIARP